MRCVVVVSVIGVQGQPERDLKECEVVDGLVRELQRATVVRECGLKERQEAQRGTIQQGRFIVVEGGVSNGDTLDTRRDLTLSQVSPYRRRYPRTVSRSESAPRYEPINKSVGLISNRPAHSRALAVKAKEAISRTCPPYISLVKNEWDNSYSYRQLAVSARTILP
jgi:hypothetical protein